jgi:hypothetical protein
VSRSRHLLLPGSLGFFHLALQLGFGSRAEQLSLPGRSPSPPLEVFMVLAFPDLLANFNPLSRGWLTSVILGYRETRRADSPKCLWVSNLHENYPHNLCWHASQDALCGTIAWTTLLRSASPANHSLVYRAELSVVFSDALARFQRSFTASPKLNCTTNGFLLHVSHMIS